MPSKRNLEKRLDKLEERERACHSDGPVSIAEAARRSKYTDGPNNLADAIRLTHHRRKNNDDDGDKGRVKQDDYGCDGECNSE